MCLFKILVCRRINETMKTHKIKVTGVENIVDIYEQKFIFCPVLGIKFRASHIPGKPFTPLSYTTLAPNAVFLTIYYQGAHFISRMP